MHLAVHGVSGSSLDYFKNRHEIIIWDIHFETDQRPGDLKSVSTCVKLLNALVVLSLVFGEIQLKPFTRGSQNMFLANFTVLA